jgi:hypothetical protein
MLPTIPGNGRHESEDDETVCCNIFHYRIMFVPIQCNFHSAYNMNLFQIKKMDLENEKTVMRDIPYNSHIISREKDSESLGQ